MKLEAKTQIQVYPIELERIEIPKHHRKKLLLMLHPRKLPSCTDSDTVFSTVDYICRYWCVEFFCLVISYFLFVRCMYNK